MPVPIFSLTAIFLVTLIVFERLGRFIRLKLPDTSSRSPEENDSIGYVVSSIFGLVALLIGFTFSMALSRYDERRADVVREANAIGTAYYRSAFVQDAEKGKLQELLRSYADVRLRYGQASPETRHAFTLQSAALREAISSAAQQATMRIGDTPMAGLQTTGINNLLDAGTQREAAMNARIPDIVLILVLASSSAAAFMIGYSRTGRDSARKLANLLLFIPLCVAIATILDLDRPATGTIVISQQPLVDVLQTMPQPRPSPASQ